MQISKLAHRKIERPCYEASILKKIYLLNNNHRLKLLLLPKKIGFSVKRKVG